MSHLNLPDFDIKIAGTRSHPTVFDRLRRRYVALTPEEWVRQHFVNYLIVHKGYPASLLANEVRLTIGDKTLRADTLLYDLQMRPRLIVEYKAPHIVISQKTFDQVFSYNLLLKADYFIISNGLHHYCCRLSENHEKFLFLPDIPDYKNI